MLDEGDERVLWFLVICKKGIVIFIGNFVGNVDLEWFGLKFVRF